MAIRLTALHQDRVLKQVSDNLVGLQSDINRNAHTWRAMALAESPPVEKLQEFIADAMVQYRRRLAWVTDFKADSAKGALLASASQRIGITGEDVDTLAADLLAEVEAAGQISVKGYAGIIAMCNALIDAVPAVPSLWPE